MKTINNLLVVFCIALAVGGSTVTSAQPTMSIYGNRTFFAGKISIAGDIQAFETKVFICTPVQPFKNGEKVAASVSDDQAWSVEERSLQYRGYGTNHVQVRYPVAAMVKCSDGFHGIFPAVLKTKTDIKAGETLSSDGYQIETKRAVKAGDSIFVLLIGDSLMSIEAAKGAKGMGESTPWFTAYKDDTKASNRATLVEAWRMENKHVFR